MTPTDGSRPSLRMSFAPDSWLRTGSRVDYRHRSVALRKIGLTGALPHHGASVAAATRQYRDGVAGNRGGNRDARSDGAAFIGNWVCARHSCAAILATGRTRIGPSVDACVGAGSTTSPAAPVLTSGYGTTAGLATRSCRPEAGTVAPGRRHWQADHRMRGQHGRAPHSELIGVAGPARRRVGRPPIDDDAPHDAEGVVGIDAADRISVGKPRRTGRLCGMAAKPLIPEVARC